jgi:hypothetical protein
MPSAALVVAEIISRAVVPLVTICEPSVLTNYRRVVSTVRVASDVSTAAARRTAEIGAAALPRA